MVLNLQFINNKVMQVCFDYTNPPFLMFYWYTHACPVVIYLHFDFYQVDFMATSIPVLYKSHTNVRPNTLNN